MKIIYCIHDLKLVDSLLFAAGSVLTDLKVNLIPDIDQKWDKPCKTSF